MRSRAILPGSLKSCYFPFWLQAPGFRLLFFVFCLLASSFSGQAQGKRIGALHFQGNRIFNSDQLQRRLPAGRVGSPYDPAAVQYQIKRLEEMYREEGYFQARIGPPIVSLLSVDDPNTLSIMIPITEGRAFAVGEIQITDTEVFPSATLLQMCPLSRGQVYQRRKLNDWMDKLKESYRELGFIRFEPSLREEADEAREVVNITLNCREGAAYSIARISVEGDPSINPSDFKKRLLLAERGRFNPDMISISLFYINQMRIYGSISESDVEISIDDTRHTVDLIFRLHPDRPAT
jgi:outer membrane protein insertion porin family